MRQGITYMMTKTPPIATLLLLLLPFLSACSQKWALVDTPNIFTDGTGYPEEDLASSEKTTTPELFYITDRKQQVARDGAVSYGFERSTSMAFGSATIAFGKDLAWDELVAASSTAKRKRAIHLNLVGIKEIARFPETPVPFSVQDGVVTDLPEAVAIYQVATRMVQAALLQRLSKADDKSVVLFVHGVSNDFESAALAMADIWHFTGRVGVPLFYTWPAGNGGLFGYFRDREAGEFTIFHLKETLRLLANTPEIERIHIIAHSRGTDITTTALRELIIAARAAGENPRETLKISSLTLAAPDLDFGVVRQRLIAEKFGPAIGQITVYTNRGDEALSLSQLILAGLRFGRITQTDLQDDDRKIFRRIKNVSFVKVEGVSGFLGHSYFRQHPGVLSDIAIVVRDQLKPGDPNRPLVHEEVNFWTLPKSYPNQHKRSDSR